MITAKESAAEKSIIAVYEYFCLGTLPENFGNLDGVDNEATSDDLTCIKFNDGSFLTIDLQRDSVAVG